MDNIRVSKTRQVPRRGIVAGIRAFRCRFAAELRYLCGFSAGFGRPSPKRVIATVRIDALWVIGYLRSPRHRGERGRHRPGVKTLRSGNAREARVAGRCVRL